MLNFEVVPFTRDKKKQAKLKITNTFGKFKFVLDGATGKPTEYANKYEAKKAGEKLVAYRTRMLIPTGENQGPKP